MYSNQSRAPVETLDKSTWTQVFNDLSLWLESKGIFYVYLDEKENYCSSAKKWRQSCNWYWDFDFNRCGSLTWENRQRRSSFRLERSLQWDKDASGVIFWLRQYCSHDHDIIEEQGTPKKVWNALNRKYSKMKASDLRKFEREITSFDRESQAIGKSPEDYFAFLKVLRRRFLLLKPEKQESLSNENFFGYLMDGLSGPEWKLTKDTLDAQPNLGCNDKLDILQQVWERTPLVQTVQEGVFFAKSRWPKSRLNKRNDDNINLLKSDKYRFQSPNNRARGSRCYQCKSEGHRVNTCPYVESAKQWAYRQ